MNPVLFNKRKTRLACIVGEQTFCDKRRSFACEPYEAGYSRVELGLWQQTRVRGCLPHRQKKRAPKNSLY